jgi:hypothetical protein
MNERTVDLYNQALEFAYNSIGKEHSNTAYFQGTIAGKFAELIVRECCLALWTEECHTSDLAFDEVKRNATRIKEHFGIDPNEITEDMLARSIKWMEQQLEDKKHFGVEE